MKPAHATSILSGSVGLHGGPRHPWHSNPRGPAGRVAGGGLRRPDPRASWRLPGASLPRMTRPAVVARPVKRPAAQRRSAPFAWAVSGAGRPWPAMLGSKRKV